MPKQKYLTVNQLCETHQYLRIGGVRSLIFNSHLNGLDASGAIVRIGRKILINVDLFQSWIESQNQVGAK